MIHVESFDEYNVVGQFDPDTGAVHKTQRKESSAEFPSGHFGQLGERELVFCRIAGVLHVFEGSHRWQVTPQAVSWRSDGDRRFLRVAAAGTGAPLLVEYDRPDVSFEDDYVTAGASAEDWDFGLYISAVASDPDRAHRAYTGSGLS